MATTADKLAYLKDTKEQIKNAIVSKGGIVNDDATFRSYAAAISSIGLGVENDYNVAYGTYTPSEDSTVFPYSNFIKVNYRPSFIFAICPELYNIGSGTTNTQYGVHYLYYCDRTDEALTSGYDKFDNTYSDNTRSMAFDFDNKVIEIDSYDGGCVFRAGREYTFLIIGDSK